MKFNSMSFLSAILDKRLHGTVPGRFRKGIPDPLAAVRGTAGEASGDSQGYSRGLYGGYMIAFNAYCAVRCNRVFHESWGSGAIGPVMNLWERRTRDGAF